MSHVFVKYPSINGIRAISVIMVVLHHLNLNDHIFADLEKHKWLMPLLDFLQDGPMGVNIFFVISGFLITSLMLQEESQSNTVSLKHFYIRRTLRIFPAYYFLLLVYFILQVAGYINISNASWATAITYTKYFNWKLDWLTSHAWSLSIEEHFYLLWPVIFVYAKDYRKHMAFAMVLIVPVIRTYLHFNPIDWMNESTIFTRIDSIATGCLLAIYKDEIIKIISPYWKSLFIFSCISLFFLRYFTLVADKINMGFVFIPIGGTHGTIANLLISIILMYSVFGPKGLWFNFINLKFMSYIGLLSYSIYLWQQPFISGANHWATTYPVNILLLFLMALFSYYVIEKPFLKLKSKFS